MKISETVKKLTEAKVEELGYRLYDVDFSKEPEGYVLTLYIDADSPVTLDDCEKVSRAVDPILDEADPIPQAYYLSVSSIGIDRPLSIEEDYERNRGKALDIKLYSPIEGKKMLTGELISWDKDTLTVKTDKGEVTLQKKACSKISPHIDF